MKITGFYIDGFGIFSDCRIEGLSSGLNVFLGANEAGKSTLLAFFRQILMGLPTARQRGERQYPPLRGGREGGVLFIETEAGRHVRMERRKGPHGGRVSITDGTGSPVQGLDTASLTGGMSMELYRNVFAFSLNELQTIESLNSSEVRSVIYSAGMGTGLQKLPHAEKFIATRRNELFRPRGQKMAINTLLSDLDAVSRELREAESENRRYEELCAGLADLQERAREHARQLDVARTEKARLEILQNIKEVWVTLNVVRERMTELDGIAEAFPAGGMAMLESLESRLGETGKQHEENEIVLSRKTAELHELKPDAALISVHDKVSRLMEALPLYKQAREQAPELETRARALEQDIKTLCGSLGEGWDVKRVYSLDRSMFTRDAIIDFRDRLVAAGDRIRSIGQTCSERQELLEQAELREGAAEEELQKLEGSLPSPGKFHTEISPVTSGSLERDYRLALSAHQNMLSMNSRLEKLEQELRAGIARISASWDIESLRSFDVSAGALSWIREKEQEQRRINLELERLKDRDSQEKSRLDQAKKTGVLRRQALRDLGTKLHAFPFVQEESATGDKGGTSTPEIPDTAPIWERIRALEGTVSRFTMLDEQRKNLESMLEEAEQEVKEHALTDPANNPPSSRAAKLLFALSALLAAASPAAWYWLQQHEYKDFDPVFSAATMLALSCAVLVSAFLSLKRKRDELKRETGLFQQEHQGLEHKYQRISTDAMANAKKLRAVTEQAETLLSALGLSRQQINQALTSPSALTATSEEISRLAAKFQKIAGLMRDAQAKLDEVEEKGKQCIAELEHINTSIREYRELNSAFENQWQEYLEKNRLDAGTSPSDMNVIFGSVEACRRDLAEADRLRREIAALKQQITGFLRHIEEISGLTSLEHDSISTSLERAGKFIEELSQTERAMEIAAEKSAAAQASRKEAENALSSAEKQLKQAKRAHEELSEAWKQWLYTNGFDRTFSPDTLLDALDVMERILEKQDALESLNSEIARCLKESEKFEKQVTDIFIRIERAPPQPDETIPALQQLREEIDSNLAIQAACLEIEKEIRLIETGQKRLQERINTLKNQLQELFNQAGAANAEEFRHMHNIFEQRESLRQEARSLEDAMKKIASGHRLEDMLHDLESMSAGEISVKLESVEDLIRELQQNRDALAEKSGEIKDRLSRLADSNELSHLREKQERIRTELKELCRRWSVYTVAAHLISSARDYFEKERQPEVITRAGEFFRSITNGSYKGIVAPPGSSEIFAVTADGDRIPPEGLSRGTAEQLYLSLRFGYVTSRHGTEPLPLLMDDILVNFDPQRAEAAAETIISLSDQLQVIFLTCHPETVDIFRRAAHSRQPAPADISFYQVEEGNISSISQ